MGKAILICFTLPNKKLEPNGSFFDENKRIICRGRPS